MKARAPSHRQSPAGSQMHRHLQRDTQPSQDLVARSEALMTVLAHPQICQVLPSGCTPQPKEGPSAPRDVVCTPARSLHVTLAADVHWSPMYMITEQESSRYIAQPGMRVDRGKHSKAPAAEAPQAENKPKPSTLNPIPSTQNPI